MNEKAIARVIGQVMGEAFVRMENGRPYIAPHFAHYLPHAFNPMNDPASWQLVEYWMALHLSSGDFDSFIAEMVSWGITNTLHQFTAVPAVKTRALLKVVDPRAYKELVENAQT